MENLIEYEGKKYRVVDDAPYECGCDTCCFDDDKDMCGYHHRHGFPRCTLTDCHFELVTETNQKE